jgi:O-antigen/teichoic acid export membrane protein
VSTSLNARQFVQQSGLTLLQQMAGAACALAGNILLARALGPAGQGLCSVAATTAALVGTGINLGTPTATAYAVSRGEVTSVTARRHSGVIALVLGGLGTAGILLAARVAQERLWPGVPLTLLVCAALSVPATLFCQLIASVLQGAQAFGRYNAMALVAPTVALSLSAAGLWAGLGAASCVAAAGIGQAAAAAVGLWHLRQLQAQMAASAPGDPNTVRQVGRCGAPPATHKLGPGAWPYTRHLLRFGLLAALANALAYATYRGDVFILNAQARPHAVGYYAVATGAAERLWMLSQAVSMVLFAQVAQRQRGIASPGPDAGEGPTPAVVRHVLWVVAAGGIVLWTTAPRALPAVFGASYVGAVAPLRALVPGVVVFNVARLLAQDFAGRGWVHLNVAVGAVCLAVNLALNCAWVPEYGAVGAAWASTVSYSLDSLIKLSLYSRRTGIAWQRVVWPDRTDWRRLMSRAR